MRAEKLSDKQALSKPLLKVLAGEKTDTVPFWLMRQAGRYLPEYRDLRSKKGGFLDMAYDPEAASEVTLQPIRRFNMDAAIIFSDILVVPHALGQHLEFVQGEGPKLGPLRTAKDISKLTSEKFNDTTQAVYDAIAQTRAKLSKEGFDNTALIGFAGAPWTVATYMIEGGGSKDFKNAKAMAYGDPETFSKLMNLLVESTADYLIGQIKAGAEAVQIFDSWAGALDPHGLQYQVIEPTKKIVERVKQKFPEVPIIGFPRGAAMHYRAYTRQTGIDAVAIDTMVCTRWTANNLQDLVPVQGNLDPIRLLAGGEGLKKAAHKILRDLSGGGHIFNLGHGIHKETPPEHVEQLAEILKKGTS